MFAVPRTALKACFFFAPLITWGQSFSGRILGVVTDSSTAVISRVVVTVSNEGTGIERRFVTDAMGVYIAPELPVGSYTVRFESPGLGTVERRGVKVDVGSETRVDVMLSVKAMLQTIDVTAQAPVLQRDS